MPRIKMHIEEVHPNKRSREAPEAEVVKEHVYDGLTEWEKRVFNEAWDEITNSKEFIDKVNATIKVIAAKYNLQVDVRHESQVTEEELGQMKESYKLK